MKFKNYTLPQGKRVSPKELIEEWQKSVNKQTSTGKKLEIPEFMDQINEKTNISNLEAVWATYDDLEKEQYKEEYKSKELPYVKPGTTVVFPIKDSPLLIEEVAQSKQFLIQEDFNSFWSESLLKLISDPTFVPDNIVAYNEEYNVKTKVQSLNIRVWIYCKSIDSVIDVSPYVISCNTDKTFQNGNFNIAIAPFQSGKINNKFGASYWDNFNTVTSEGFSYKSYLEKVVQANDIVFIRYEHLLKETSKEAIEEKEDIFISFNKLANSNSEYKVWDMIGFVDGSNESYSAEENSKMTVIHGRDISKLFAEDGSYFIPLVDVEDTEQHWVYLGRPQDSWYKRNVITGDYNYLWSYKYKKINEVIWFIINVMSNIGICKDEVFRSWQDKRVQSYEVDGQSSLSVKGIWQIVKAQISSEVQRRVVVDSSIGNPNGTLMDYMSRVCQYPFVEFYFDTYINTIDIIVRQPPFTEAAIMNSFRGGEFITITTDNVISYSLSYDSRVYSWFQVHVQNNNLIGDNQQTNLAFVPIVYLNEFAELWGNRKLEVNDMYAQMKTINGAESESQFVTMQAALLNDLQYLVESNMYLPFTRTGVIEINGDRRIKVGTFILNQMTNEFFYVTGVSNSAIFAAEGVDRRTTLQVERGMYAPILEGKSTLKTSARKDNSTVGAGSASANEAISPTGNSFKPSYFKIVDLKELKDAAKSAQQGSLTTVTSPKVNKDQFEYFLNRKMYGGLV